MWSALSSTCSQKQNKETKTNKCQCPLSSVHVQDPWRQCSCHCIVIGCVLTAIQGGSKHLSVLRSYSFCSYKAKQTKRSNDVTQICCKTLLVYGEKCCLFDLSRALFSVTLCVMSFDCLLLFVECLNVPRYHSPPCGPWDPHLSDQMV